MCSLPKCSQQPRLATAKARSRNSIQVSHGGGRLLLETLLASYQDVLELETGLIPDKVCEGVFIKSQTSTPLNTRPNTWL